MARTMCPHCGEIVGTVRGLTVPHPDEADLRGVCLGSQQVPRNPESDARRLWNGEPNRRFAG